jgi:hypothetical protein
VNPDTCIDGLEGTVVKGLVSSALDLVMSLVKTLLAEVDPSNDQFITSTGSDQFPSWINDEDKKLLKENRVAADAVVAADGSGDYRKVTDAISAAPEYSMKRYVIYVKKGVYLENVEISKKKWNIMMIGDGIDATIISGSRNKVDGWTTFRSATFGKITYSHFTPLISLYFFFFLYRYFEKNNKENMQSNKVKLEKVALGYDRIFCFMFKEDKNKSLVSKLYI